MNIKGRLDEFIDVCGFACIIGEGGDGVDAMLDVLRHRGPDDAGVHRSEGAVLGFRRLSIIDLAGGVQPMANEDRTLWLVCNGEIYNYVELRRELEGLGHAFRTASDVEVILHGYEAWGADVLVRLRGMFAFTLWDERRRTLFAARDRLGKKPFHYSLDGGRLLVASEMKAILQDREVPRRISRTALRFYLMFHYIPAPLTIYEGIRKLPPGHLLRWNSDRLEVRRYWNPDLTRRFQREEDWIEELRETLKEAVRLRLRSDVPFGAYLSGGIDSSIVVGLMSGMLKEPVRTFAIGFDDPEYSELPHARRVAEVFGTDHRERIVRPDAAALLDRLVWHYDEPFGDSSAIPTWHVANASAPEVKVVLSGDGGDESFAGYHHHRIFGRLLRMRKVPAVLPAAVRSLVPGNLRRLSDALDLASMPPGRLFSRLVERFHSRHLDDLLGSRAGEEEVDASVRRAFDTAYRSDGDAIRSACFADLTTYLPSDILTKVDIASMANSQEVRCPFLDHRVVELALRMPGDLKLRDGTSKYILKRAFRDLLPREILEREKRGFSVPMRRWIAEDLRPLVEDALLSPSSRLRDWLRMEAVREVYEEHRAGKHNHADSIWAMLFLERWLRMNIGSGR